MNCVYVTLEHKTSPFLEIEIYTSTKSWKSGIWGCKKNDIEKIAFNVVQIKFLAMHITNQKYIFLYI